MFCSTNIVKQSVMNHGEFVLVCGDMNLHRDQKATPELKTNKEYMFSKMSLSIMNHLQLNNSHHVPK